MNEYNKSHIEKLKQELKHTDWYIRLEEELNETFFPLVHDDTILKTKRHIFYDLVEKMLEDNQIPLARSGPFMDAGRKSIDTIVIHHTEEEPEIRLSKLSAIGFIRQYAKAYLENDVWGKKGLRGKPIWSGHFRDGQMVFFAYHWLIRPDGKKERLLEDGEIGHQSHELNPRSIGIALSGNYEHSTPPLQQIKAASEIINNYSFVDIKRIFGHLETNPKRTCPGDKYVNGWKKTLLSYL